jgi:hypothetical protein
MMLKKYLVHTTILAILIAITFWLVIKEKKSTFGRNEADFAVSDTSRMDMISFKKGNSMILLKKNSGVWHYDEFHRANPEMVNTCLNVLSRIEIKSPVPKQKVVEIKKKVLKSGVEVKISNRNRLLRDFYVFADHADSNIYMMRFNSEKVFIVHVPAIEGNFTVVFNPEQQFWRDHFILRLSPGEIRSVTVENFANPSQSFELQINKKKEARLSNSSGKILEYNPESVSAYLFCFRSVKAERFLDDSVARKAKLTIGNPQYQVTIKCQNEDTLLLKTFLIKQAADQKSKTSIMNKHLCYILINNRDLVVVKYIEIDPITRELDFFVRK